MKTLALAAIILATLVGDIVYCQLSDKSSLMGSITYALPLNRMKEVHSHSIGGYLLYEAPSSSQLQLSFRAGFQSWSSKNITEFPQPATEYSKYLVMVPLLIGFRMRFSESYIVPYVSIHGGLHLYSAETAEADVIVEEEIVPGFILIPEVGWRIPFSSTHSIDARSGVAFGTGAKYPPTFIPVSLGIVFQL